MSPEELTANLGTLAKSGTTEFLAKAESTDTTGTGNLIGAFGLGFYSRCVLFLTFLYSEFMLYSVT